MNECKLKTITESEAQQLANISNCVICVDKSETVIICANKKDNPVIPLDDSWHIHGVNHMFLNVRITSDKVCKEKIWRPE